MKAHATMDLSTRAERSMNALARGTAGTKQNLLGLALALAVMLPHGVSVAAGPEPVDLRSTLRFAILSGAAITSSGAGIINGDVGASPIAGSAIGLNAAQVHGTIYAVDASGPAGSVADVILLGAAKGDLTAAYNDAKDRTPEPAGAFLNPGGGNLGGLNLVPGLYKFTGTALITGAALTLTGAPHDIWIFQIASDLQVGNGIRVVLVGGARAGNVYWQVGTSAVVGTSCVFKGTILADQSITMMTGSAIEGRLLAFNGGVTYNGNNISSTTPWSDASDLGGDWKSLAWFGDFYDSGTGWIYHLQHRWMFAVGKSPESIWLYSLDMGWLWTGSSVEAYLYSLNEGTWLWYHRGSSNPRWFYNTAAGIWDAHW